jgi:uncharacterized protein YciI
MKRFMTALICLFTVSLFSACSTPTPSLQAIFLSAGPQWKQNEGPEKQDLGAHFAYTKQQFEKGALIAYGPTLDDMRGMYLYRAADRSQAEALVKADPGVASGVLKLVDIETWTPGIEKFSLPQAAGEQLFVLNYLPGKNFQAGLHITKQKGFGDTVDYVTKQFDAQRVLVAGPVSDVKARVIYMAKDIKAVQDFVAKDPSVLSGLLNIEIKPWAPFQRQGISKN